MFVLQNAQFNGIFFDEENVVNAIGDFQNATIKKCKNAHEALNASNHCGKWYAVSNGRISGIFFSWEDCSAQVNKFPCAKYKSFYDIKEAIDFVTNSTNPNNSTETRIADMQPKSNCIAYVDGSFNPKTMEYGWGAVMFFHDEEYCISGSGNDEEDAKLRNVAGEILASRVAISKAIERGYDAIDICYDYYGIEMWATGQWKRKTKQTIAYYDFIQSIKGDIAIYFHKVKGHTGVELNEKVDRLAKNACGIS